MAPKPKKVVKHTTDKSKEKKNAAKKAAAKAKATAVAPEVVDADASRMVGRKEMSGFLTSLKYKANNPSDSNRTQAQALLAHYHQLTDEQKQGMVKKYQEMGGIRNLNWTMFHLNSGCFLLKYLAQEVLPPEKQAWKDQLREGDSG